MNREQYEAWADEFRNDPAGRDYRSWAHDYNTIARIASNPLVIDNPEPPGMVDVSTVDIPDTATIIDQMTISEVVTLIETGFATSMRDGLDSGHATMDQYIPVVAKWFAGSSDINALAALDAMQVDDLVLESYLHILWRGATLSGTTAQAINALIVRGTEQIPDPNYQDKIQAAPARSESLGLPALRAHHVQRIISNPDFGEWP